MDVEDLALLRQHVDAAFPGRFGLLAHVVFLTSNQGEGAEISYAQEVCRAWRNMFDSAGTTTWSQAIRAKNVLALVGMNIADTGTPLIERGAGRVLASIQEVLGLLDINSEVI
jgi:hypothetical protein